MDLSQATPAGTSASRGCSRSRARGDRIPCSVEQEGVSILHLGRDGFAAFDRGLPLEALERRECGFIAAVADALDELDADDVSFVVDGDRDRHSPLDSGAPRLFG